MKFEKQVFISYAHLDNQPLTPQQQGWITRFHASLSAMLSMRLGRPAEIWRDVKLTGNDIFADEIVQQFPKTALLISVVTPRYVESEWCTREVKEFCKTAEQSGGLVVDNKSRVLKVIKMPVDDEQPLPDVMKLALGYPFYILDEQQTPLELDPAYGEDFTQKYNLKMAKLAFDIAQLIKKIDTGPAAAGTPVAVVGTATPLAGSPPPTPAAGSGAGKAAVAASPDKPAVYLAECSFDVREARESLEAELRMHGYMVYPDHALPVEEEAFVPEVEKMLALCKLSIHLIGSRYGAVLDGPSEKSMGVLQNDIAIRRSRSDGLQRLIWVPRDVQSDSPRQQQFINSLSRDPEAQFGADLITGDLENMKSATHAALKKLEAPPAPATPAASAASASEAGVPHL